jgi:hypothetical protein
LNANQESRIEKKMILREVLTELSTAKVKELMIENFGKENARYHTLDEIPFFKLIAKLDKNICPICSKEFVPNIEGGKEIDNVWTCLSCYWRS